MPSALTAPDGICAALLWHSPGLTRRRQRQPAWRLCGLPLRVDLLQLRGFEL